MTDSICNPGYTKIGSNCYICSDSSTIPKSNTNTTGVVCNIKPQYFYGPTKNTSTGDMDISPYTGKIQCNFYFSLLFPHK